METTRYTLVKIPIQKLIEEDFDVKIDRKTEIEQNYLIVQDTSLLFDQIERLRGYYSSHISEVILVVAKKNPKQEPALRRILQDGFLYNGIHYMRFGKSASQGKEGITAFVCDNLYDVLYKITQMDIEIEECVISKYEAHRCLAFSSCNLIRNYMPNIVIIGEYEKTLQNQLVKYVVEREKEFTNPETGETKKYNAKEIEEGYRDIKLSPFDGCGCHEFTFMETVSTQLGLDYNAAGVQIRLPFIKGYSIYVPFREILKTWGYTTITDIYGNKHPIDTIDCIWNTTMFKGHTLFFEKYGRQAWNFYMDTLRKYQFKLGISKYSHHIRHLNKYTRMNFQYLQCLDLWNPNYVAAYENKALGDYDILDSRNDGKIIQLAKYTTSLFEKIIQGDKFYSYKFLGISDTEDYEPKSKYLEAALLNDEMLNDPAIKQFIYRRLKKSIDEAKVGKIYCSGFYHTGIGDMIGYLQFAAGEEPVGCLNAHELYSGNFDCGEILSFRSPLVDPSEVNKIQIVHNDLTDRWFGYLKDQDIVMFNLYDISAAQQGGADFDGDIFFLCNDPVIVDSKIEKHIILDIEDKATTLAKPYIKENIIEYEVMTRDNRIGEITNAATSIENRYTTDPAVKAIYANYTSLLRILQGKEIDFLKTGMRWQMSSGLRKYMKQLPYFLLYNYPAKMKIYKQRIEKNKRTENEEDKVKLNVYHSPSPMNELCDYICAWEKRHVLWNRTPEHLANSSRLIINHNFDLSDKKVKRTVRRYINAYADEIRMHVEMQREKPDNENNKFNMMEIVKKFKHSLTEELLLEEEVIANYVIQVSYSSFSISKALAWAGYGDYILKNIKEHSDFMQHITIRENPDGAYEYLGKYYEFLETYNQKSQSI